MNLKRAFPVMIASALAVAIGAMAAFSEGTGLVIMQEQQVPAAPAALTPPPPAHDGTDREGVVNEDPVDNSGKIIGVNSTAFTPKITPMPLVLSSAQKTIKVELPTGIFTAGKDAAGEPTSLDHGKVSNQGISSLLSISDLSVTNQASGMDNGVAFSSMFTVSGFEVNDEASFNAGHPVKFTLTMNEAYLKQYRDVNFQYNLAIKYSGGTTTGTFSLSGKAQQAEGSLISVKTSGVTLPNYTNIENNVAQTVKSSYTIQFSGNAGANTLEKLMFNFQGTNDSVINKAKLDAKSIPAPTVKSNQALTSGAFSAAYTDDGKGITVTVPTTSLVAGTTYELTVNIGNGTDFTGGDVFKLTLKAPSTAPYKFNKSKEPGTTYTKLDLGVDKSANVPLTNSRVGKISDMFTAVSGGTVPQTIADLQNTTTGVKIVIVNSSGTEIDSGQLATSFVTASGKPQIQIKGVQSGSYGNCEIRLFNEAVGTTATDKYFVVDRRSITVSTSTTPKEAGNIDGIDSDFNLDTTVGLNGKELEEDLTALEIEPGDVLTFSFDTDFFTWSNGTKPYPPQQLTESLLSTGKITAVKKSGTNSDIIETPVIKHVSATSSNQGYSYIEVKFKEIFPSTKDLDFTITLGLAYRGKLENEITLEGTIANEVVTVTSGTSSVDISDGLILEAEDSVQGIKIALGEGVILTSNLRKGGRYYGYATTDKDRDDEDLMRQHSAIKTVYNLYTIGLNDTSTTVRLDEGSGVHVYNRYMEYLGSGADLSKLPYSTKYYVATQKLSEDDGTTSGINQDGGEPVEEIPGLTTGTAGENNNYNPGTGR